MEDQLVYGFRVNINTTQEEINNWAQKVKDSKRYITEMI